ncbi:ABC transporter permease [Desulfovibrio mangrovi]|uniref:ABC transporter permease n=1 Tax=Desulfovibrio mangrovi TaxID=2976983 RepID=UPI002246DC88|nr:ABC transporter permease [Desulfovibrio mangrovi]UZP67539.1 ABC transporter permease [Desulfovibrio mangrovi]
MISTIAWQNLFHDKIRLSVTLIGIVFAVVLITVQVGLFLGFVDTISGVIRHSGADVWVASKGVKNFDIAMPMSEGKLYEVRSVSGVAKASPMIVHFALWKKKGGGQESIEVVGFDMTTGLGGPWNLIQGHTEMLDAADTVFLDHLYLERLGVERIGQEAEIEGKRARVVGLTSGIRSFTTSPYVFTAFKNAPKYTPVTPEQLTYVLVKAEKGLSPETLRDRIRQQVPHVDVFTSAEFAKKTEHYWMFSTGAGVSLLLAALLGFIVGMVVVAQTLYATTLDHMAEFATLKAMGAPNSFIYKILILQAIISASLGYGCGMIICMYIVKLNTGGDAAILLPQDVALGMLGLTIIMCVTASFISIRKVTTIDPAIVFKGR